MASNGEAGMSNALQWLPAALRYGDFDGDYDRFLAVVYEVFERDFKQSKPHYHSHAISYDSRMEDGKEAAFWHITSSFNPSTGSRELDLRRAERIPWPRPMMENCSDKAISVWKNERIREEGARQTRILIWLEGLDYLVVLAEMRRLIVLITAYCTDSNHQRRKLRKERDEYYGMQKPP